MGLFITNPSQATSPGVWAVDVAPPTVINGVSLGYVGLAAQFDWGPVGSVYTPSDGGDLINTFAPPGMPRQTTGWYAVKGRVAFTSKIVRVLHSDAVTATVTLQDSGPTNTLIVPAKYPGVAGNAITVTIANATDGVTTHFKLTATLTDALGVSGTTTEVYDNIDIANVAATSFANSLLLGQPTRSGTNLRPANGTFSLATGSNGTAPATADYVGTLGAADKGLALFELEAQVRCVCVDGFANTGSLTRAAVNAGLQAHADAMSDRLALCDCQPSPASFAAVQTDFSAVTSDDRVLFFGASAKVYDDAGVLQVSPWSTLAASALVNLEPQQSHAWWNDLATQYYLAVKGLAAGFSTASFGTRATATAAGICLPIQLQSGRWALLHDRTASQTSGKQFATRRRIEDYLALSIVANLPSYVNGPNVASQAAEIKTNVDGFLGREVDKGRLTDFATDIGPAVNTAASVAAGTFAIAIRGTSPAPRERIILMMSVGPTVVAHPAS